MSLQGQWITNYSGTNTGTLVADLDELDDCFAGTAVAWDDKPEHPNSLVRIRTSSKSSFQNIEGLPISLLDNFGNPLSKADMDRLGSSGLRIPECVDITLELECNNLSVKWSTPIGTSGSAVASASKTRNRSDSDLAPTAVDGWKGFKDYVNSLGHKRYIFRGQSNNRWLLRTSFHRTGRSDLERYVQEDMQDLQKTFSALTQHAFNLVDPLHYAAFINLAPERVNDFATAGLVI